MKSICFLFLALNLGFSQVLLIDSIISRGRWVNPESIRVSDDQYGTPSGGNDNIIVGIANPADTINGRLDSVKVYLEQHVSDTTRAFWYVMPIIWGSPGTATPQQPGSLTDVTLSFNVSASVGSWYNLVGLDVDLRPVKGAGATPSWFADYLYVYAFVTVGIEEEMQNARCKLRNFKISPNPFTTFAAVAGHEKGSFALYDASGRQVGIFRGNQIGSGLTPGVYFVQSKSGLSAPQRIVKIR